MADDKATSRTKAKKPVAAEPVKTVWPFGQLVKELRADRGVSQASLAHKVGISPGYVGLIEVGERGERPSIEIVRRFAQALNCNVEEFEELMRASGHLGEHESLVQSERPAFAEYISSDKSLTRDQQGALIAVYEGFVGKGRASR